MGSQTGNAVPTRLQIHLDEMCIHNVGAEKLCGSVTSTVGSLEWTVEEIAQKELQLAPNFKKSETIILQKMRGGQNAPETIQASGRNLFDQDDCAY